MLEEGRTMSMLRSLLNSALAATKFLGRESAWSCEDRAAFGDNVMSDAVFHRGITGARGF